MKGCKHKTAMGQMWRDGLYGGQPIGYWWYTFVQPGDAEHHDRVTCMYCGAWLPLGPANDADPNVQIEIRAAEMAGAVATGPTWPWTLGQIMGWQTHDIATHPLGWPDDLLDDDEQAGYLARQIATHDAEQGGEG